MEPRTINISAKVIPVGKAAKAIKSIKAAEYVKTGMEEPTIAAVKYSAPAGNPAGSAAVWPSSITHQTVPPFKELFETTTLPRWQPW